MSGDRNTIVTGQHQRPAACAAHPRSRWSATSWPTASPGSRLTGEAADRAVTAEFQRHWLGRGVTITEPAGTRSRVTAAR